MSTGRRSGEAGPRPGERAQAPQRVVREWRGHHVCTPGVQPAGISPPRPCARGRGGWRVRPHQGLQRRHRGVGTPSEEPRLLEWRCWASLSRDATGRSLQAVAPAGPGARVRSRARGWPGPSAGQSHCHGLWRGLLPISPQSSLSIEHSRVAGLLCAQHCSWCWGHKGQEGQGASCSHSLPRVGQARRLLAWRTVGGRVPVSWGVDGEWRRRPRDQLCCR